MPTPRPDEDHDGFMDRCMADPEANESFPEADQRAAFCESQFSESEEEGADQGEGMSAPKRERLRAATEGRPIGVDRQLNAIMGYVVAQEGPFKSEGRGEFDAKSLRQIVKLMKTTPRGTPRKLGVKSHFAHPTLSDDGIGKFLGRVRRPYIDKITTDETAEDGTFKELEVVRGDLYFDKTALEEPVGGGKPLGAYVMDLAESDPDALSSSLVLSVEQEYRLDGKGHHAVDENGRELPPLWRPTAIYGSDLVDEGDAVDGLLSAQLNIDGLPDAALRRGCELLDKHFPEKSREFIRERCAAWLERYLTRRFGPPPAPRIDTRTLADWEPRFDDSTIDLLVAAAAPEPYDPARDAKKLLLKRRVEGWKR